MGNKGYRIFLSYCDADKAIKDRLVEFLNPLIKEYEEKGISVTIWDMEKDCADVFDAYKPGGYIYELEQSHIMIPIITPNATDESEGVKRMTDEVRVARESYGNKTIQVVPFVIGTEIRGTDFHASLSRYSKEWVVGCGNINEIPERAFENVVGKVKTLLDGRIDGNVIRQVPSNNIEGTNNCQTDCFCVGRENKIKEIDEVFKKSNVVVLYGEGGMGKTTLAKSYIQAHLNEGVTYYFKECGSLKDFITNLVFEDKKGIYDNSKPEDKYLINLNMLKNLDDKYIFILDGYDEKLDDDECLRDVVCKKMACKFIITSRSEPSEIEFVSVDKLDEDSLLEIVYHRNKRFRGNEEIKGKLNELFKLVECHTLTVELAAALMSDGDYDVDEVYRALFDATDKIKSRGHSATANDHLITLFGMANLNDEQIGVMQILSMFPSVGISRRDLKNLLKYDNNDIVNYLIGKALVRCDDSSHKMCSLHKMISSVVYNNYPPTAKQVDSTYAYWQKMCDKQKMDFSMTEYCLQIGEFLAESRIESFDKETGADILSYCGDFNYDLSKFDIALTYHKKALDMYYACHGEKTNHPSIAGVLCSVGNYYCMGVGDYKQALEYYQKALGMYYACYGEKANNLGISSALNNIGACYSNLGNYKQGLEYYIKALDMQYACYGKDSNNPDIAKSLINISSYCHAMGDYLQAYKYCREALDVQYAYYGKGANHPDIAESLINIGCFYDKLGGYGKILEYYQQALEMFYVCYGKKANHPNIAIALNNIGWYYFGSGEYEKALAHYNKSLNIYNACYGENANHPDIATAFNNIGWCYFGSGECKKALEYYQQALDMFDACYGEDANHPNIAVAFNNMGHCCRNVGDYKSALEYYRKALDVYYVCYGKDANHPNIATVFNNIGRCYSDFSDYKNALEYQLKALNIKYVYYGENANRPDIAEELNDMGSYYSMLNEYEKALVHFQQALNTYYACYGKDANYPEIAGLLNNIGNSYWFLEKYEKALEYCKQALDMFDVCYGKNANHPNIAIALNYIGYCYFDLGKYEEALKYHQKAAEMYRVLDIKNCLVGTYENIAECYVKLNNEEKAKEYADLAKKIRSEE